MSLAITLRSELLKTKRSTTWILTLVMATFAPILVLLIFDYDLENNTQVQRVMAAPWDFYFYQGTGLICFVFMPMFAVLMSTLLPQIEFRNHTWKQVCASPQSYGKLFFSKFLIYQFFILSYLLAHTVFMGLACVASSIINPEFKFFSHHLDWGKYGTMLFQGYVSILALSAFQFCLGLRFKSFLIPIGVGVLFSILGMINMVAFPVMDADKFFFTFSGFIIVDKNVARIPFVLWLSVAYTAVFLVIGFWDFSRVRER